MYGTCETLCRELAAKYPGDAPLMLVIWSPEEIQALADGLTSSPTFALRDSGGGFPLVGDG
ncbi:hypothetical protein ECDEC13C_5387 [Escherichia coli DEC13C]|nr:hypothetical protein ECDEC13C_5387 [Escherichia coli DEC13C]